MEEEPAASWCLEDGIFLTLVAFHDNPYPGPDTFVDEF
jgi:hypothetical protein